MWSSFKYWDFTNENMTLNWKKMIIISNYNLYNETNYHYLYGIIMVQYSTSWKYVLLLHLEQTWLLKKI
jgi:hypothetical protein